MPAGTVGGAGASVSFDRCWASAATSGVLRVTNSTLRGSHSNGTVTVDRFSNADLRSESGAAPSGVVGTDGKPVYQTVLRLEGINGSGNINKKTILYCLDSKGTAMPLQLSQVTELRLKLGGAASIPKDLNLLTGGKSRR